MSNSKSGEPKRYPFALDVASPGTRVTVLDAFDRVQAESFGEDLGLDLEVGYYTVRTEEGGRMTETVVRHTGGTRIQATAPAQFSAAPLDGAATSHEYYTYPAVEWSRKQTAPPLNIQNAGRGKLFLFIRAGNRDFYRGENPAEGFSLHDEDGALLSDLPPHDTRYNLTDGWFAYSADTCPGGYLLRYAGENPREVPVGVFNGFQTQVFLTWDGRPRFDGMRVFLAHAGEGFVPDDETARAVDRGLDGLANGYAALSDADIRRFLEAKFQNPLLGIVAVHMMLARSHPDRSRIDRGLIDVVMARLSHMIPDAPDLAALTVRNALCFGQGIPAHVSPFHFPPMLAEGLRVVTDAAVEHPRLIPEGSLIDGAIVRLYGDSPFTGWRPFPREAEAKGRPRATLGDIPWADPVRQIADPGAWKEEGDAPSFVTLKNVLRKSIADVDFAKIATWIKTGGRDRLDWVQEAVLDLLENAAKARRVPSVAEISRSLRLPKRTISHAIDGIMRATPAVIDAIRAEWPEAAKMLKQLFEGYRLIKDYVARETPWRPAIPAAEKEEAADGSDT